MDGNERTLFRDAGRFEDWISFYLWPPSSDHPKLLFVHRFAGGSDGQQTISVVDLTDNCHVVFDGRGFSFKCIAELGDGGFPELVGGSNVFSLYRYALAIYKIELIRAPRLATYAPDARRYVFANKRYPEFFEPTLAWYKSEFETHFREVAPIPADAVIADTKSLKRNALLHVLYWAINAAYAQGFEAGKAVIDANCDPALAHFTSHFLRNEMQLDDEQPGSKGVQVFCDTPITIQPSISATLQSIGGNWPVLDFHKK